jgi:nitrilase
MPLARAAAERARCDLEFGERAVVCCKIRDSVAPSPGRASVEGRDRSIGPSLRAAVVQAAPVAFDRDATLDRVAHWTAQAAADGAKLVVFPEAFVSGYPKGADFGAVVGSRSAEGREWFRRYHDSGVDIPGPAVDRLGGIAAEHGVHLVIGVIERTHGTLYCTVLMFDGEGSLLGRHRKLMPTAMERLIWGFGDGSTLTVVPTAIGRVGAVICWENYMPQLRLAMYDQKIELYCAPTVDDRETWLPTMRHIAMEGRCFVLSANQFARRSDFPIDYPVATEAEDQPIIAGGSCIIDPMGTVLAGPARGAEAVLTADLDLDQIVRGKFDLDVTGHYARPDVFRLIVDTRSKQAVTSGPLEGEADPDRDSKTSR